MRTLLKNLLFPPRCAACGQLLSPLPQNGVQRLFCEECALQFEREMRLACPSCNLPYPECRCQPSCMKRAGSLAYIKLAPYGEGEAHRVMRALVLDMKRRARPLVAARISEELEGGVRALLCANGYAEKDVLVTYLPRLPRKRRMAGTDQARELAMALSARIGAPFCTLLSRTGRGKEQKTLNAQARMQNLQGAFRVVGDPKGRCVLLVDDLVTTGAGMSVATRALVRAGAAAVISVSAAYTPRKK